MTNSVQFKRNVRHTGLGSKFKSPGRIAFIIAALEAYEQAQMQNLPQIQQVSYLYEIHKQCRKWLAEKQGKTSVKSQDRQRQVNALLQEVPGEMDSRFPAFRQALTKFEQKKAQRFVGQTTGPKGVYAHESSLYAQNKAAGKFANPAAARFTASASLYHNQLDLIPAKSNRYNKAFQKSSLFEPARNGLAFAQLTAEQFRELDKICQSQFNVLYLSKIQRLKFMAIVENGMLQRPGGSPITLMPGKTVQDELNSCLYAVDKYGNLFVMAESEYKVQINHTTLCAGGEVLCAGTMSIKNGQLRGITNNSGHYKPDSNNLTQVLNILLDSGVPMANVIVVDSAKAMLETTANPFMAGNYKPMPKASMNVLLGKTG